MVDKDDPRNYRMQVTAHVPPGHGDMSHERRMELTREDMALCLARAIGAMGKYDAVDVDANGDDLLSLELFVFTREELNIFMRNLAAGSEKPAPVIPSLAIGRNTD